MKYFYLLLILLFSLKLQAQWSIASGINNGRNDDITFVNDSIGYVAGGNTQKIYKTFDGGLSWSVIYTGSKYNRTIDFLDESRGFCGTLDSSLLMTTDYGNTWIDIADSISPKPKGVCGLDSPNDSTIYGCGIYSGPAFVIKSTDRGNNWTYIDMSQYANSLVEVKFISNDTGFVSGMSNINAEGGVILYTTDGGQNWQKVFTSNRPNEYIWKLQKLNDSSYYGSVSSVPGNPATYVYSNNGGINWNQSVVDSTFFDIQLIGFIDSLHGWTAGGNKIYETLDGGNSWQEITFQVPSASLFNRFLKVNDTTAFFTGVVIYRYNKSLTTDLDPAQNKISTQQHQIQLDQNPTHKISFRFEAFNNTKGFIQLLNTKGEVLEELYRGKLKQGSHRFESDLNLKPQIVFISVRTNEGYLFKKVVVQ